MGLKLRKRMPRLFVLEDRLTQSNCYLLEENGSVLIIDPNDHERILKIIREHQWNIDYILLTHEHCDHIQGLNGVRRGYPEALVIATAVCSENLGNRIKNMSGMMGTYLHFKYGGDKKYVYSSILCNPANLTFDQEYEFHWKGHMIQMELVPGHTMGSCCIRMDETILFSGDYLIMGEEDITRLPGGNEEAYETYAKPWIEALEDGIHIYPGHGTDYILKKEKR